MAGWRVVEGTQVVLDQTVYGSGETVPFTDSEEHQAERDYLAKAGWIEPVPAKRSTKKS